MQEIVMMCLVHGYLTRDKVSPVSRAKTFRCRACSSESAREHYDRNIKGKEIVLPDDWLTRGVVKNCSVHGELNPHEVRFRNENNIICIHCSRERTKKCRDKNRLYINQKNREKRRNDKDYRDELNKKEREYNAKNYSKQRERILKNNKDWRLKNPEKHRDMVLRQKYNISLLQYEDLLKEQDGKCKICKNPETAVHNVTKKIKSLAVDHCHRNENNGVIKVRGLLCSKCNCMIGYARESIEYLQKAIDYIKDTNDGSIRSAECGTASCSKGESADFGNPT